MPGFHKAAMARMLSDLPSGADESGSERLRVPRGSSRVAAKLPRRVTGP